MASFITTSLVSAQRSSFLSVLLTDPPPLSWTSFEVTSSGAREHEGLGRLRLLKDECGGKTGLGVRT